MVTIYMINYLRGRNNSATHASRRVTPATVVSHDVDRFNQYGRPQLDIGSGPGARFEQPRLSGPVQRRIAAIQALSCRPPHHLVESYAPERTIEGKHAIRSSFTCTHKLSFYALLINRGGG